MKIKHLLLAAAAMVFAVACNDAPEPTPEPTPDPTPEVHDVWGIAGTHQGDSSETQWKPENSPAMAYADGYYSLTGVELKAGDEFKFVKDNAWTENRGYNGDKPVLANYYYAVAHNGNNIKVEVAGTYDIYLNEAADKFYLMEAGKTPAEAADAETIVPEPTCAATAIIAENPTVICGASDATYVFKVTTANAVKAATMHRLTSLVDDTYTAEYILLDGWELSEGDEEWDGLNKENFEVEIWCTFEEEYTFFLAVQDAEGLTKMVSVNITAPEGPTVYEDYEAKGTATFYSDEFEGDSSVVEFVGEEYKVRIVVNTHVTTEMEYSMYDEEWNNEVYITSAWLLGIDDEPISRLSTGTLGIYDSMWMGQYADFSGTGVDGEGKSIVVRMGCVGLPEGLGGGAGQLKFEVASAKFYHSVGNEWEIEANDRRYILEVYSTAGDGAVFVIDNYYTLDTFMGGTPFLQGQFMAYDPEYPEYPYVNLEQSFMFGYVITDLTFLMVDSAMGGGQDLNSIQAMFNAASHTGGSVAVTITTPTYIPMYSEGGEGGGTTANVDFSLTTFGVTQFEKYVDNNNVVHLTAYGRTSGNLIIELTTTDGTFATADGMYFSVEDGTLAGYYYDFMDDADYNFVEGGFTVSVVDGQYTLTVGEAGCYMQDADATKKYSIAPGTYDITLL